MKYVVLPAFIVAFLLTGACSASQVINTGGNTKCKDFLGHDESKQGDEVAKMLKDKRGAEPATAEISVTRLAVSAYCKTLGTPESKISEAPHG